MTVWFTSDWHLGHRNILNLGPGRPFSTIEEHDETLIENHNKLVKPNDVVWVLGDVAMGDITKSLAKCAMTNGHLILLCGNHDRPAMTDEPHKREAWTNRYLTEGGFAEVLLPAADRTPTVTLPGGRLVAASHYPYAGDSQDGPDRYAERRPVDHGLWLLHGHVHHSWRVHGRQVNVGVDVWGYEPVRVDRVSDLISDLNDDRGITGAAVESL